MRSAESCHALASGRGNLAAWHPRPVLPAHVVILQALQRRTQAGTHWRSVVDPPVGRAEPSLDDVGDARILEVEPQLFGTRGE